MRGWLILAAMAGLTACGGGSDGEGSGEGDEEEIGGAGGLPSGVYTCTGYMGSTWTTYGMLEIDGDMYRGVMHEPLEGSFATYSLDGDGGIEWSGGLGVFSEDGAEVTESRFVSDDGAERIEIDYTTPAGNAAELECSIE